MSCLNRWDRSIECWTCQALRHATFTMPQTLIVVVDSNCQYALCTILSNDVVIECRFDHLWDGRPSENSVSSDSCTSSRMMSLHRSTHSSQINTLGPAMRFTNFMLALTAKRAIQHLAVIVRRLVCCICHLSTYSVTSTLRCHGGKSEVFGRSPDVPIRHQSDRRTLLLRHP